MTTRQYDQLNEGPMDEIDAAIWSGDMFHNLRARWEKGLKEAEDILTDMENENVD